ncbi:MAG: acetylglutamate kinase, partial [Bacteroidia bacterium]|nr:acetylglutamate kinase [Bacteroidia bacterium]
NAIGLSGVDANLIPAVRRSPEPIDYGFVGDPDPTQINASFLSQLAESGIVPVFCAITHDGNGSLLNTNADTIAYSVATALSEKYETILYYCFEKEGVLRDLNDPQSLVLTMTQEECESLKQEGIVADGMIPKLDNSFRAIAQGVSKVIILHATNILTGRGTLLSGSVVKE